MCDDLDWSRLGNVVHKLTRVQCVRLAHGQLCGGEVRVKDNCIIDQPILRRTKMSGVRVAGVRATIAGGAT